MPRTRETYNRTLYEPDPDPLFEEKPKENTVTRNFVRLLLACALATGFSARAAEPDSKVVGYTLPENIQWKDNAARTNQTAILYGDPTRPGPYAVLIKWRRAT